MDVIQQETLYDAGVYPKRPLVVVRGAGAHVWDEAGREYIDCVGGHGVCLVGHCHPSVSDAIAAQAKRLITCPGIFYNDRRAVLLQRLAEMTGLERAFLCNSGTEAVEGAIKFARLSAYASGQTTRTEIVATMRGFHGRTMGALSATWNPRYRKPFEPLVPGFVHVPYDQIERADEAIGDRTAAVLIEVVQGEGGVRPASVDYVQALRQLCDDRGAMLIIDEVQTGFGRTGAMFAFQHYGITPDILCLAKGMAGGVPMGAVVLGPRVTGLQSGVHGSTFGGNPLACAAALATMDVLQREDLAEKAREKGAYLMEKLRGIEAPVIRQVRGMGLMVGVELRTRARAYIEALIDKGILTLPAGPTVIRLLPPLVIGYADLDAVLDGLECVLRK